MKTPVFTGRFFILEFFDFERKEHSFVGVGYDIHSITEFALRLAEGDKLPLGAFRVTEHAGLDAMLAEQASPNHPGAAAQQ